MRRLLLFSFLAVVWMLLGWGSGPAALAGEISEPSPAENAPAAAPEAEAFLPPRPEVIFAEDLIKKLADDLSISENTKPDSANYEQPTIDDKARFYGQQFFGEESECQPAVNMNSHDCLALDTWAGQALDVILSQDRQIYLFKYSHLTDEAVTKDQLAELEQKALNGDLQAISKLVRFYENPDNFGYDPEKNLARKWLLEATKHGSEEAVLELGFSEPYVSLTRLDAGSGVNIEVLAACESIADDSGDLYPACFMYVLRFASAASPIALQVGGQYPHRSRYHLILNPANRTDKPVPQVLSLRKYGNDLLVELISYAFASSEINKRSDFFSLQGEYLGADDLKWPADYFFGFRKASRLKKSIKFEFAHKAKVIKSLKIKRLPSFEAMSSLEDVKNERLHAMNKFGVIYRNRLAGLPEPDFQEALNKFKLVFAYDPNNFYNGVTSSEIDSLVAKFENGSLEAARLLAEYYWDPFNAAYSLTEGQRHYNNWTNLVKAKNAALYGRRPTEPYLARTKTIIDNLAIEVLVLCQAEAPVDSPVTEEDIFCYDFQVSFNDGWDTKYHYVMNPGANNVASIKANQIGIIRPSIFYNNCSEVLRIHDGYHGKTAVGMRDDYSDAQGHYLYTFPPHNSTIVYHYKSRAKAPYRPKPQIDNYELCKETVLNVNLTPISTPLRRTEIRSK